MDIWLIRRIFPGVLQLDAGFSWRLWRRIRRYALWSYLDDLLVEGTAQLDKLLLAVFLPIVALTPYALSLSLAGVLFVAVGPMTETFFPMAASLRAGAQREDLARLLVDGSKLVTAIAAPLAIFFCCFGDWVLRLWVPEGAASLPAGLVTLVTPKEKREFEAKARRLGFGSVGDLVRTSWARWNPSSRCFCGPWRRGIAAPSNRWRVPSAR